MRGCVGKAIALGLVVALAVSSSAQATSPNPEWAATVKRKADGLAPRAPISVVRVHAEEEYGTFLRNDAERFTFYDIDRKVETTLQYVEVRKIKDGYGGYNSPRGRHTDRTKAAIVVVVVLGALGGLLAAVATARN
jgi:hypothetical protein